MLTFIFYEYSSQKSEFLHQKLSKNLKIFQKTIFIVPSSLFDFYTKTVFDNFGIKAQKYIEILNFKLLVEKVLKNAKYFHLPVCNIVCEVLAVKCALMNERSRFDSINSFFSDKDAKKVHKILSEFENLGIKPDFLQKVLNNINDKILKQKINDILYVYKIYKEYVKNKNWITLSDLFEIATVRLNKEDVDFSNCELIIDGFSNFSGLEFNFITELAKNFDLSIILQIEDLDRISFCLSDTDFPKTCEMGFEIYRKLTIKCFENSIEIKNIFLKNPSLCSFDVKFLKKNIFEYELSVYEGVPDSLAVIKSDNQIDEVFKIANLIKSEVMQGIVNFSEILILTPQLNAYKNIFNSFFSSSNISFFVDQKVNLNETILGNFINLIFDILKNGPIGQKLVEFLKFGRFGFGDAIEDFENYVISSGAKYDILDPKNDWEIKDAKIDAKNINLIKDSVILKLWNNHVNFKKKKSAKVIINEIYKFFDEIEFNSIVRKMIEDSNKFGNNVVKNQICVGLEHLSQIFCDILNIFKNQIIDFSKFCEIFKEASSTAWIENDVRDFNGVLICDLDNISHLFPKIIILMGFDEFPRNFKIDNIFNENERETLEHCGLFDISNEKKQMCEKHLINKILSFDFKKIYFSMVRPNSNKSLFIDRIFELFPKLLSDIPENNNFNLKKTNDVMENLNSNKLNIDPNLVRKIYNSPFISVSKLEAFNECSLKYFLKNGLKASFIKKTEFSKKEIGSAVHYVLFRFFKKSNWRFICLNSASSKCEIRKIISEEVCMLFALKKSSSILGIFKKKIENIAFCVAWYNLKFYSKSKFYPLGFEVEIKQNFNFLAPEFSNLELYAKLDRVDILTRDDETFLSVIDYKSSARKINLEMLKRGLNLQLPFYMNLLLASNLHELNSRYSNNFEKSKRKIPVAMLNTIITAPIIDFKENEVATYYEKELMKQIRTEGVIEEKILPEMENSHDKEKNENYDSPFISKNSKENLENIYELLNLAKVVTKNTILKINSGEISPNDYKTKKFNPCKFCEYSRICINFKVS